nr:MAG TPA: hypothetical protein [Caudoviricetes sp.]
MNTRRPGKASSSSGRMEPVVSPSKSTKRGNGNV